MQEDLKKKDPPVPSGGLAHEYTIDYRDLAGAGSLFWLRRTRQANWWWCRRVRTAKVWLCLFATTRAEIAGLRCARETWRPWRPRRRSGNCRTWRGSPAASIHPASSMRASCTAADLAVPIDAHEMAWVGGDLWVVNTLFSCLCTLDGIHNFVPRWPPFCLSVNREDRCRLNGVTCDEEGPRYVTSLGAAQGRRPGKAAGGCLIDVELGCRCPTHRDSGASLSGFGIGSWAASPDFAPTAPQSSRWWNCQGTPAGCPAALSHLWGCRRSANRRPSATCRSPSGTHHCRAAFRSWQTVARSAGSRGSKRSSMCGRVRGSLASFVAGPHPGLTTWHRSGSCPSRGERESIANRQLGYDRIVCRSASSHTWGYMKVEQARYEAELQTPPRSAHCGLKTEVNQ